MEYKCTNCFKVWPEEELGTDPLKPSNRLCPSPSCEEWPCHPVDSKVWVASESAETTKQEEDGVSCGRWSVVGTGEDSYLAERLCDGKLQQVEVSAHCLACAKADILTQHGGEVDLRGHSKGNCSAFLRAMAEEDQDATNN